ncbi:T9SS type A sorting domain-containing protein [Saprospira sp. CCB-QB6]|uniref:T9SS type A sorting domain-containing protein n=1 Tax=Saprospira sp. CCB-QB6 TaxID=3023936 RepID=UPI00234ADD5E|nr:T9SS type A sorting domain-containing protein [Saprospira sp. CCB-QB6]WCL83068.1 T9SS type A sorting domain-containing protein [Saprospira sp. CCB-QB6]
MIYLFCFFPLFSSAQVIWQENFDAYADGTTLGNDNNTSNPAADWQTDCPTCVDANDYLAVQNGVLECRDSNGPASWTSELIDLSAFPGPFTFSMDFSEIGDMEGCDPGCGTNCVDWVRLEVSLDGGAFSSLTTANGGTCNNVAAGGDFLLLGEFTSYAYQSACFTASSVQFRVSFQTWAGSEYLTMDNLLLAQNSSLCSVLDLKTLNFEADYLDQKHLLSWNIEMENENLAGITLEHAIDGTQFFPLQELEGDQLKTSFINNSPLQGYNYYRLNLKRENGESYFSPIKSLQGPEDNYQISLGPNPLAAGEELKIFSQLNIQELSVYNALGQLLCRKTDQQQLPIPTDWPAGTYILQIKAAGLSYYRRLEVY